MTRATGHLLVFGHGYSAGALSDLLISAGGWHVTGTTRSARRVVSMAEQGVIPVVWPGADLNPCLVRATHILVSIAPDENGDPVISRAGQSIAAIADQLEWIGYLSTTAVYGNRDGGWVTESSRLEPTTARGRRRVRAEQAWQKLADQCGLPLHIFRLAGIYGPGRGPLHNLLSGRNRSVIKDNQYFNRVHVDDIARLLRASIDRPAPGSVYNICDNLPAQPHIVRAFAAELLGRPRPEEIPYDVASRSMSPMARSFYSESKRVSNTYTLKRLGTDLRYPDYRAGLRALRDLMP